MEALKNHTLIVFDFDSTLIAEESLVSLLSKSPHQKEIQIITEQGIKGQISMLQSYQQRLAYLDPQLINIQDYLQSFRQVTPGMVDLIHDLSQQKHCTMVVLSQGPHCIVEPICAKYFPSISRIHSVRVDLTSKQIFSTDFLEQGKAWYLSQQESLSQYKQVIIVGDGVSDMKVKQVLQPQFPFVRFISIGFGLVLSFSQTKQLADYFVTQSVENELRPLLMQLLQQDGCTQLSQRMTTSNFTAGPSALPNAVMQEMASEGVWNYQQSGMAFAELSHRSKEFETVLLECKQYLYELLECKAEEFEILFMQGGGHAQFSAIPMNCLRRNSVQQQYVNYIVNGEWSNKALEECKRFASHFPNEIHIHQNNTSSLSEEEEVVYTYYCDNETIHGLEWNHPPSIQSGYLVCDMSSNFLTKPIPTIQQYGIIFACAQKNFGISGLTLVLIRRDVLQSFAKHPSLSFVPTVLDYSVMAKYNSLYNTPPTLNIFVLKSMLLWMKRMGGLQQLDELAKERSAAVYQCMEECGSFYHCPVKEKERRSRMNVVCRIVNEKNEMDTKL